MNTEPEIDVGIICDEVINFKLKGDFVYGELKLPEGTYSVSINSDSIKIFSDDECVIEHEDILLQPGGIAKDSYFELQNVTIGIGFHWEQKESQRFSGALRFIIEEGKVRVINRIGLEAYLKSVISSEMNAASSKEFLKAHAVISRSWLLAQLKNKINESDSTDYKHLYPDSEDEIIRWYDREEHMNFDVCADDHCQRYQGISRIHRAEAINAVEETSGVVLVEGDKICDARFSKCCGGVTENFENVWEPVRHKYLTKVFDATGDASMCIDLRNENEANTWIRSSPQVFCNETNPAVLKQVLPDFDQATVDFFRWEKVFTQIELAELLKKRSGIDFGEIIKLEPVQRGHSGRIIKLKIYGTRRTLTVGKELEIRKWLSETHLYSSAFVIDYSNFIGEIPRKIKLTGAGWGHGVGLCQIGAAVMGEQGYSFKQILMHYFQGASLKKIYIV